MENNGSAMYIDSERLFDYAANTARLMKPTGEATGRSAAAALRGAYHAIRRCHDEINRRYASLPSPPSGCEWIMDNFYMISREYNSVYPRIFEAKHLRSCDGGTVVHELAGALVLCSGGEVTQERFSVFMEGFQSVTVLRRAELELVIPLLSCAVIEEIRRLCEKMRSSADIDGFSGDFSRLFATLRLFSVIDCEKLISSADITDRILRKDPTGEYALMDSGTRDDYLRRVEKLARSCGTEEHIFARRMIERASEENRHVGHLLFTEKPRRGSGYICLNILLTLFLSLLCGFSFGSLTGAALMILPVSELVKSAVDFVLCRIVPPKRLFRMDTENGIPDGGRTICVISTLVTDGVDTSRLEQLYHECKGEGKALSFGLLADLPTAKSENTEKDALILASLRRSVTALNLKYGSRFYLFTRRRSFDGEEYSPKERKRGAITELAKLLCEHENELTVIGDKDALAGTKYILTLDSDTLVYPGSIGQLVGAILHPLNRPVTDTKKHVVTSGHAIIHPRIDTELKSACATDFALIFAGSGGCDPYGSLAGELYMDAFSCGGFAGKGLIDARAFLDCTERFPKGRILSHDAPEGAVLRGAYMGDAEFSDSFPSDPLAWFARSHRWIRGDWQNLPFIFMRGISDMDRWRLFDNLRRSLFAPFTLLAVLTGFFSDKYGIKLAAWAALAALVSRLLLSLAEGTLRRRQSSRLRRHTRLLSGIGGAVLQTFLRLWLLPYEAWVSLSAALTALWRMTVSHRKLLQWKTAAQSAGESGLAANIRAMWFPVVLGVILMAFCEAVIGKSAGLMWLVSPAAAAALALPSANAVELSDSDCAYLKEAAKRSYGYFASFFSPDDSFLPPDNFQEQPPVGLAHRTSPTNISLALTSAVSGFDMGFLSAADMTETVERTVETLERMPKHRGHLFNWYDTRTLAPLTPAYISTVDSGNLYAGLVVAKAAMLACDEITLAMRIDALMEKTDFSFLYDSTRGLFHICYDAEKERGAGGWYDLMASEAMLTSYIAIAKGDIPVKHWRRLSRAQLQKDGYRGLASWTGTMFEYLMPALFLPICRGSLLYESAKFCVYVQKRRVRPGLPWGISESAFFSLDSAMNYRYKAHGCGALALKRGQDSETVVSPYSSFLALAVDPEGSIRNLRRLEGLGASGRFGFIEALDLTPSRCRSERGEAVRCTMAHHAGMSITAAANAVCRGSIRRRFMSDPAMGAFALLLQERLPDNGNVIRRDCSEIPERPERNESALWTLRGGPADRGSHGCVLSDGAYNIMSTDICKSKASCGTVTVYDSALDGCGVRLEVTADGRTGTVIPASECDMWELSEDEVRIKGSVNGVKYEYSLSCAAGECGEKRTLVLSCDESKSVKVSIRFTPILAVYKDYVNHSSFCKLGISAEISEGMLTLHRLRRGGCPDLWLSLGCDRKCGYRAEKGGTSGFLSDPAVCAECLLDLRAGEKTAVSFALCLSMDPVQAAEGVGRILHSPINDKGRMVGAAAAHMKLSPAEIGYAMELSEKLRKNELHEAAPAKALWRYGISGELPLISCDGNSLELEKTVKSFCLLKSCGVESEMAVFSDEMGEYRQPVFQKLTKILSSMSLESLMNSPGGVHIVPMSASRDAVSRSAFAVGVRREERKALILPALSRERQPDTVPDHSFTEGGFVYYVNNNMSTKPWQNILTNGRFGYIASDSGSGYMWLDNAREMRLNDPPVSVSSVHGSELLWVEKGAQSVSLFAANDGRECAVTCSPGVNRWEKTVDGHSVSLTAFIAEDVNCRVFILEGCKGLRVKWVIAPVLGAADGKCIRTENDALCITVTNPECRFGDVSMFLAASQPFRTVEEYAGNNIMLTFIADETAVLLCGCDEKEKILALREREKALSALDGAVGAWKKRLGNISLHTGYRAFDSYMNTWCACQIIACRLMGRASLYQSGGAIGFRDQLQDASNIILLDASYAKKQITDCCAHQYEQGDVMHWWHSYPNGDRGVRTHCSDDMLWLCRALCEYCEKTGDYGICDIEVGYLSSPPLSDKEKDRYEDAVKGKSASVLDHAVSALECCMKRGCGEHSLPFFGSGDWNDALDEVKGESVWLGFFASSCAYDMAKLLERLGRNADRYLRYAAKMRTAAEGAWTGRWYMRGYFPDGTPLGGEERIDLLPQSWAVLCSGKEPTPRDERAVDAAFHRLVDRKNGIVKLFAPPYSEGERRAGYIVSYGEGFRENGGQYTHGAIWLAMACFRLGKNAEGWEILKLLLPEGHDMTRYGAEPFVLSADVYSAAGHEGEAGWTWYTGSAGWYFRAVYETMLGLTLKDGKLTVKPKLPPDFPKCEVHWTSRSGRTYKIEIDREAITVNGERYGGEEPE
ncbi:MAG: glucoamylase family protein [Eubacteriales bacterium]|nr:glucoamylase family protein [Eubacteriales bacterium]